LLTLSSPEKAIQKIEDETEKLRNDATTLRNQLAAGIDVDHHASDELLGRVEVHFILL
jgi:hypothetical protein